MENSKIYSAICTAMAEIGAIGKDSKNQQQDFMYRGVDAVTNALNPVLIKNHIFVVPEVMEQMREERQTKSGGNLLYSILKVKYTFYADDGSNISAIVTGEGMDSGDKASNKAMSVAFKYACFQVLCIPTEEMKDPDADAPEPSTKKATAKPKYIGKVEQVKLQAEILRVGWKITEGIKFLEDKFPKFPPKSIEFVTETQYKWLMERLEKQPAKVAPANG